MTKIFLTGASGYIGGEVLHRLAATGHLNSVQSIFKGLTGTSRAKPAFWIQVSGATLLSAPEIASKTFGEPSDKVYNDFERVEEIRALARQFPSRAVDNFVLDKTPGVNTALVVPATIYGPGSGPVNQRSVQVPELSRVTIQRGKGIQVKKGLSTWDNVHIQDLSTIFLRLVERAAEADSSKPYWNQDGVYFTGSGSIPFSEISQRVAQAAFEKGYSKSADVDQVSVEEADQLSPHGGILWGTNARCEARRAAELLGWKPVQKSLEEEIPETVAAEAQRLGVTPKL
ncbi:uncharacterized protein K452DRAFT_296527 [Neofusicoccum parvum]|uniref:Uncharacterized protein K452DRAFT_296527 n=1 Tax=Neofusicoccum parvum TaxID=310453 RepID=A0ACB5S443_9PEZI|nr:uncharacterized protein K452DRAFT_296527 [Neofusicoccum parvum]